MSNTYICAHIAFAFRRKEEGKCTFLHRMMMHEDSHCLAGLQIG